MASSTWWLDPRQMRDQRERLGEEPYDPFGVRRRPDDPRDPRNRPDPRDDPRQQYDPRNVRAPPVVPAAAAEVPAAAAAQPAAAPRGLLDMLAGALGNPLNPGAGSAGERSGYGPIPGLGGGAAGAVDPRRAIMMGQLGMRIMNPYAYGGYR